LAQGGLSPSEEMMRSVRKSVKLPIFVMIRPRAGNFEYSDMERFRMRAEIAMAQRLGMNGIVLGLMMRKARIDLERTRVMVWTAKPLPVTFHRAFDEAADLDAAARDVIRSGAARILTSGGASSALAGIENLTRLVKTTNEHLIIVPGGGINASNVARIAKQSGASEVHSGLGSVLPYGERDYDRFESEVRKLTTQLASVT